MKNHAYERVTAHIVSEQQKSHVPASYQARNIRRKWSGKLLFHLHRFGFSGIFVFIVVAAMRSLHATVVYNCIIEDHASGVVKKSIRKSTVNTKDLRGKMISTRLRNHLVVSIRCYSFLKRLYKKSKPGDFVCLYKIALYLHFVVAWHVVFQQKKYQWALLARTSDPKRLALGTVAGDFGCRVVTYTVERMSLRSPAPFPVDLAFCWSRTQRQNLESVGVRAVQMSVGSLRSMKLPIPKPATGIFGLLLNAKCQPSKIKEWVTKLYQVYRINNLLIRPHPGYDTQKLSELQHGEVCDWKEPLSNFFVRTDMVFAMNTNAIIDALLHGVPVAYVGGLDPLAYDIHGFVSERIVYPFHIGTSTFEDIQEFYSSQEFMASWNTQEFTEKDNEEKQVYESILRNIEPTNLS